MFTCRVCQLDDFHTMHSATRYEQHQDDHFLHAAYSGFIVRSSFLCCQHLVLLFQQFSQRTEFRPWFSSPARFFFFSLACNLSLYWSLATVVIWRRMLQSACLAVFECFCRCNINDTIQYGESCWRPSFPSMLWDGMCSNSKRPPDCSHCNTPVWADHQSCTGRHALSCVQMLFLDEVVYYNHLKQSVKGHTCCNVQALVGHPCCIRRPVELVLLWHMPPVSS